VPGLDRVLGGGLPRGALIFIVGAPGAGKTILATQTAFRTARAGRRVLFLTALSEPHNKLLEHMRPFAFFDSELIGNGVELLNLQSLLKASTVESVDSIVSAVRRGRVSLAVIDGFGGVSSFLASGATSAEFIYELGAKLSLLDVTVLVTSQTDPRDTPRFPEFTVADGLLALHYERHGSGHRRYLEALKLRGAAHLGGLHTLSITSDGMTCYPQL
jgi:circadian clock protein KaiC